MTEQKILVFIHVLSAAIWAGYYLLLSFKVLPSAIRNNDLDSIKSFEKPYHTLTMIILVLQVLTGFRMAMILMPMGSWFDFANPMSAGISFKFILLGLIIVLIGLNKAVFGRRNNLRGVVVINYLITLCSVLFIYTGVTIRFGGL